MRVLLSFGLVLFLNQSFAQDDHLPGHKLSLKEAVGFSKSVYIGRFETLGTKFLGSIGSSIFEGADVVIVEQLAGAKSGTTKCTFKIDVWPPEKRERLPTLGKQYILFIYDEGRQIQALCMLDATTDAVNAVRQEIAEKKLSSLLNERDGAYLDGAEIPPPRPGTTIFLSPEEEVKSDEKKSESK